MTITVIRHNYLDFGYFATVINTGVDEGVFQVYKEEGGRTFLTRSCPGGGLWAIHVHRAFMDEVAGGIGANNAASYETALLDCVADAIARVNE